jgi:hypothetical protein
MRRPLSYIATLACAAGLAFGIAGTNPAQAANPAASALDARTALLPLVAQSAAVQAEQVQYRQRHRHRGERHRWRGPRHHHRRHYRGGPGIHFHFGPVPRHYSPAPRYYRPAPRHAHRLPAYHVRWCQNRYRSYRVSDNTFQPYRGPRRACRSPYY